MTRADAEAMAERMNAMPWPDGVRYEVAGDDEPRSLLDPGGAPPFGGYFVRRVTERWARVAEPRSRR